MPGIPRKTHAALYRIPSLVLVCIFAVCTLLAASYGLSSYHRIQKEIERNFAGRTGLSYVAAKIRQSRAIAVELPNPHTLVLVEEVEGQRYATSIYLKNGMLMEYFGSHIPNAAAFETHISAANEFMVVFLAEDLIEITLGDGEGTQYKMAVYMPQNMRRGAIM
jgi:hypothetical protein